jgi:hypothetical protein
MGVDHITNDMNTIVAGISWGFTGESRMKSLPFVVPSIALAVLSGCAEEGYRITPASAPIVMSSPSAPYIAGAPGSPGAAGSTALPDGSTMITTAPVLPLRAGWGRIESILAIPSSGAGSTASGPTNTATNRITAKMDDGSKQYFDTQAQGLAVGNRIEITHDLVLLRHAD